MSRVLAFIWHTLCVSRFRATSGLPLDRSKGKALDASRICAVRIFCRSQSCCAALTKEIDKNSIASSCH